MMMKSRRRGGSRTDRARKPSAAGRQSEAELSIESMGARGDGIGALDGRKIFVPFSAPGDRVRVRLEPARADGVPAQLLELVSSGPHRQETPCLHFGTCGGCTVQHLEDEAYFAWKRGLVVSALAHRGLEETKVVPLLRTPPASRRRAVFSARRGRKAIFLGFNERGSTRLVDLEACHVLRPEIVALLPQLRDALAAALREGEPADIAVALLDDGLDVTIRAGRDPDLDGRLDLAAFAESADLARLSWAAGSGAPEPIAHRREGIVTFDGVPVIAPPGGFLQASREGEAALLDLAREAIAEGSPIVDLFSGIGTFALPLARRAIVRAFDSDPVAIAALDRAARFSDRTARISAIARDLFRDPLEPAEFGDARAILFDPPRAGAREQAARIAESAVPLVVGVSCNPASFARDARTLADGGYRLEKVIPVDQFVWSAHVELVGIFRRD